SLSKGEGGDIPPRERDFSSPWPAGARNAPHGKQARGCTSHPRDGADETNLVSERFRAGRPASKEDSTRSHGRGQESHSPGTGNGQPDKGGRRSSGACHPPLSAAHGSKQGGLPLLSAAHGAAGRSFSLRGPNVASPGALRTAPIVCRRRTKGAHSRGVSIMNLIKRDNPFDLA